jgi:hypothetical protein
MEADDLLCSCNARSKTPLVGRAQWKINQPPSPEEIASELGGIIQATPSETVGVAVHRALGVGKNWRVANP